MSTPGLVQVDTKIERANQHIRDLHDAIDRFRQSNPYEVLTEDHPGGGERAFKLRVLQPMPAHQWAAIIGDVLHNLRSSLDVLIWQLIFAVTHRRPGRWAKFPFAESAQKFEVSDNLRKIQAVSNPAVHLIKAAKPYRGGNDALWVLHALDVADKHHLLLPVATVLQRTVLNLGGSFINTPWGAPAPLEDGAILIRFQGDRESYMGMNVQFAIEVAFGQGQIVEGKAVLPTLVQLAEVVKGTILPFRDLFP